MLANVLANINYKVFLSGMSPDCESGRYGLLINNQNCYYNNHWLNYFDNNLCQLYQCKDYNFPYKNSYPSLCNLMNFYNMTVHMFHCSCNNHSRIRQKQKKPISKVSIKLKTIFSSQSPLLTLSSLFRLISIIYTTIFQHSQNPLTIQKAENYTNLSTVTPKIRAILATRVNPGSTSPFSILNRCRTVILAFSHNVFCDMPISIRKVFMFLPSSFFIIFSILHEPYKSSRHICPSMIGYQHG